MSWLNPNTALALIRRRWRNQTGITAPNLVVRPLLGWRWRIAQGLAVLVALLATFFCGMSVGNYADVGGKYLSGAVSQLADTSRSESSVQIERRTQARLAETIKQLESDNLRIREEVTVLEQVVAGDAAPNVNIARLSVDAGASPGTYQYRLMLTRGGGASATKNVNLHWVLTGFRGDKALVLVLPNADVSQSSVVVDRYMRAEGTLTVPSDFVIHKIELQILSGSSVLAKKMVDL
jgi:hypothetical protein